MVFSSSIFIYLFLPAFLAFYWAMPGIKLKNLVILIFSLAFYAWGEPVFVIMLLASVTVNWFIALQISAGSQVALWLGVSWNLTLLGVCKYAGFLAETVNSALGVAVPVPQFALPLGVSFFSFQAISYLVDVWWKRAPVERSWFNVALYITMFPQLVAGPIVRFSTVAHRLTERRHTLMRVSTGARIFIIGLAQKVLIANEVGRAADAAFASIDLIDAVEAWIGLAAYTLQIYFDFAGYSNMAIGIGFMMGFGFPRNFRLPYTSLSITEFWRRWHMSLSRWFRDYLYIPLGGNRVGPLRTYFNLLIVFVLCGFWHGAAWNFIVWGAHHGLFLIIERMGLGRILAAAPKPVSLIYTLLVVMSGWVWFRAETLPDAVVYFGALFELQGDGVLLEAMSSAMLPYWYLAMATGAILALSPTGLWNAIHNLIASSMTKPLSGLSFSAGNGQLFLRDTAALALLSLSLILLAGSDYNPFLYFRF